MLKTLWNIWIECRQVNTSVFFVLIRNLKYRLLHSNIICSNGVTIKGGKNISTSGMLRIGMSSIGFMNRHDRTFLNVNGQLVFNGDYSIGKGCRFDIGSNAKATFGNGYVNPNTTFIIMHGITVGDNCVISWGCQFLDEDFHHLQYSNMSIKADNTIRIGSHVWIACNVLILKGTVIPDGCMIAAGSVVNSVFSMKNALIGGNPARIIRENIFWE